MSLLQLLKEDKDARKIFGKRELTIIEKQLYGLTLTQSEKNRLSRDIRKKLRFIQKLSRFEEEFFVKKGAIIKKIIDETKEMILEQPFKGNIEKIILYGSVVENKLTFRSDIDLVIKFKKINSQEAGLIRKQLLG